MQRAHQLTIIIDHREVSIESIADAAERIIDRNRCVGDCRGGLIGAPGMAAYTASKFAVVGLAESLRVELYSSGVSVTTICPGYVRTGLHKATRYHGTPLSHFLEQAPKWARLSPERVARLGVDAALNGDAMLTLGVEKVTVWLKRFSLTAYKSLAARASLATGFFAKEKRA